MRIDKDNIKIILILLVVCLGIGYSYLNTELNINGTANINSANWSVYWNNVQVESGSVTAPTPTIDSDKTTVSYTVTLAQPGDYYEFTVDAVNGGSIDAMIDTMDSKLNGATITTLPNYLNYTVTYSDGVELEPNHQLLHNTTETYKIRIEYRTDINANQLPSTNQALTLQFAITYRQATEDSTEVPHPQYVYTSNISVYGNNNHIWLRSTIPNGITQYNNASDALAALRTAMSDNGIQFYLKHRIEEEIVTESYVEFIVTSAMANANPGMTAGTYTIRGDDTYDEDATNSIHCPDEYYDPTQPDECISPYYENNVTTLLNAFGNTYCTYNMYYVSCEVPNLYVDASMIGNVDASKGYCFCGVGSTGDSSCYNNQ